MLRRARRSLNTGLIVRVVCLRYGCTASIRHYDLLRKIVDVIAERGISNGGFPQQRADPSGPPVVIVLFGWQTIGIVLIKALRLEIRRARENGGHSSLRNGKTDGRVRARR